MSPEPRWGSPVGAAMSNYNASAVRLRGTRSASSLRHEHSYEYDEDEEEEEDYGTSIIKPSEAAALRYDDAELEEATPMIGDGDGREYASVGRARGASFASTASSISPGASPENEDAEYERTEFPFSLDGPPPLTPVSVTSEASVTTRYSLPDDGPSLEDGNENVKESSDGVTKKRSAESRARGESFSSVDTDRSEPSQTDTSSTSNLTTPSPGTDLRMTSVLGGDDNDTEVPSNSIGGDSLSNASVKDTSNAVYLHSSPSSSLEELSISTDPHVRPAEEQQKPKKSLTPTTPTPLPLDLDLRGISNLAEAEALVRRAQQAILASASLPAEGPESPGIPLSAQLAAYGEILALERRFARGEKQREMWAMREDSDGEADGGVGSDNANPSEKGEPKTPKSAKDAAKEARIAVSQKKRDVAVMRQRGATTDAVDGLAFDTAPGATVGGVSSMRQRAPARPAKHKRPHTAEGAPQTSWGFGPSGS